MARQYGGSAGGDRETIIEWAMGIVADPGVLFLDTETTGFGPAAEIVDIAMITGSGEVVLDSLVKPRKPIPPDATRIHGIRDADVDRAPAWESVFPIFAEYAQAKRVVVYNASFDRGIITSVCRGCNLQMPFARWDCAMDAYAAYVGERSTHRRGGYRLFKLEEAARAFGITPGGHRAAADAEATRLLVHALARVDK